MRFYRVGTSIIMFYYETILVGINIVNKFVITKTCQFEKHTLC